jgi:hypothetical protein
MELADIIRRYRTELESQYGPELLPEQRRALDSISRCQRPHAGQSLMGCPACGSTHWHNHSCGHRSCPRCQNHLTTEWLERQRKKLLPVAYYLVTFTLPLELRKTAYCRQRTAYEALIKAAVGAMQTVAANPRHLGAEIGITAVLHTNARNLDYHPHVHLIVPAGGIDTKAGVWRTGKRDYLFPVDVLKILFREKFLAALRKAKLYYPKGLHKRPWVVNIRAAGYGEHALEYLSRYLYRGVIHEKNIISDNGGQITFAYRESKTDRRRTRTLRAAEFLFLLVKHVLPKRFRRSRDYGFLHGNAKAKLIAIQLLLRAAPRPALKIPKPPVACPKCGTAMVVLFTKKATRQYRRLTPKRAPPRQSELSPSA